MKLGGKLYLTILYTLMFIPIILILVFSFNSTDSTSVFKEFSLRNYREMFRDEKLISSFINSLVLAVSSSVLSTIIGTFAAIGIHAIKNKYLKAAIVSATNLPMINPDIITGVSLMLLFVFVGTTILNVSGGIMGFWTMLIAHVTFSLPYVITSVLPKLKQMDKSLPEAAMDLGCTPFKSFLKVELPAILPGVLSGMIMAFTLSLDDFTVSLFTNGNSFTTFPLYVYSMTNHGIKLKVYAISTIIFAIILILLLISNYISGKDERMALKQIKKARKNKSLQKNTI